MPRVRASVDAVSAKVSEELGDAMPGIQRLHKKFQGKPVEVIGIAFNETGDPADYMKDRGFTYGLLLNGETIGQKYGISGIPHFFIIGKDGKVLWSAVGHSPRHEKEMAEAILWLMSDGARYCTATTLRAGGGL